MTTFLEYDEYVINEIAKHIVEPNPVEKLLAMAGKPIDKLLKLANKSDNEIIKKINSTVSSAIEDGLKKSIKGANTLFREKDIIKEYNSRNINITSLEDVKHLGLEDMDRVADSYDLSNAVFLGLEGSLMGAAASLAEGIPFAQLVIPSIIIADVTSSLVLLSRHVCQIATSYGYSSEKNINIPHILAAMAPINSSDDEGYLMAKGLAVNAIREGGQFVAKGGKLLDKECPQLIKLIAYITERLGLEITEKELGILVPEAGAILNGGVNIAFQQSGHITAKDYFRQLILEEKYGEEEVYKAINHSVLNIRASKLSPEYSKSQA